MTIIDDTPDTRKVVARFTMNATQLRDALHVHVAAGKDDALPTLTGVHVSWDDLGPVVFAATDRYRLAVATTEVKGEGDGVFLLPRRDAIELIKVLPKPRRGVPDPDVTVTVTREHVTVFMVHDGSTLSKEYRTLDGEYPKYQTLVPRDTATVPTETTAWNPDFMADVAKLPITRNRPVRWKFYGENRPALATFQSDNDIDWEYLLMPVRHAG